MNRMKFLVLTALLAAFSTSAREVRSVAPGNAAFLISACQEYVELYKKRGEERFGAFLTTSKEESFRAGYCLGAIMHANSKDCPYGSISTYQTADAIASMNSSDFYSESGLLDYAVCR